MLHIVFRGDNRVILIDENVIPLCSYWFKRCEIREPIGLGIALLVWEEKVKWKDI